MNAGNGAGPITFNQCLFDGAASNGYGFYIGGTETLFFENCIFQRYGWGMWVNNSEPVNALTIENCTFGNIVNAAIHSASGSNLITCTNTAFIGNGSDNQYANFNQSGFTYCAFGTDSLSGYSSSDEAVNASAFANVSGNNFQEVTTGTTTTIGKGTTLSNVTVDYLGFARSSGAYDIGAYQYVR
jgi:hypothetical protein